LTGRENVFLNGAILGMPRAEIRRKFDEIVDFAGVSDFIDTPVKRYSSGMAVRLAFAVAAHLDAEILLVDEVLAVGDAEFERKCLRKMNNVARDGRTVLLVSHNLTAVQRLCGRVAWLEQGRIVADGRCLPTVREYLEACKQREHLRPLIKPTSPYQSIECLVNGGPSQRTVALVNDEPLRVVVVCEAREPALRPRLDLAFYRADGLKIFAFAADRALGADDGRRSRRWELELCFERLSLAPSDYYFDLGVRADFQGEYEVLWNRVCELTTTTAVSAIANDAVLLPPVSALARAA
jgi:lipopolysaccharide transport system ATP-binding protein